MGCTIVTPDARPDHSAVPCLALRPKAICALDRASQLPASASSTGKVCGDRASPTDTAADEVLMRDRDFERVILAHGEVLERGGPAALRAGYAWLLDGE